jgi:hypothetical protein
MTSFPENIDPRVWLLSNKVCEGTISEQEVQELESLLKADRNALVFYVDFLKINSEIQWLVSVRPHSTLDSDTCIPTPERSPILDFLSGWTSFFNQHSPLSYILLFIILCTTLAATTYLIRNYNSGEVSLEAVFVAQITATKNCQWSTTGVQFPQMTQLKIGEQLHLEKGIAQITYSNKAQVLLEGPTSYTIDSPNSGFLSHGKLMVRADSEQSRNFTILTCDARFVDLGTEFGVMIDDKGRTAVAVFAGKVNAEAKLADGHWSAPISLRKGQAVICEQAKFLPQVALRSDFPALVPPPPVPPPSPYERWLAFDRELLNRRDLVAYYDFQTDPNKPDVLPNRAPTGEKYNGKIQNATWTKGRFPEKSALDFIKDDSGVRINLPGKYQQMTLIAWVNCNPASKRFSGILLSDNWNASGKLHWQLQTTGQVEANICGRAVGEESSLSSKSLPSDCLKQWCMIAVTIKAPNQISIYVNGELFETLKRLQFPAIEIGSAMIGGWDPEDSQDKDRIRNLAGSIDELMIFQNILTPEDIRSIYASGKPGDQ